MSYEPLHHKYRPQTFADLVGQEAIATTLTNAILTKKIAPAYLFTGPRGTGKTSSARILAKSLNCLREDKPTAQPCGVCDVCQGIAKGSALDVIEIDAASNTGVDNIREIIERAQFAPVQCRYKVYVIDECLTGDSLVQTSEGLIRIDDPKIKEKKVLSYNDSSGAWEFKKVVRWLEQGKRQTLIIKTTNREIRCTGNHLIRTEQGWIPAKDVKEKARILAPVPVDAAYSYTNLEQMDAPEDLPEDISSKGIHTGKKHTTWNLFSSKLNYCNLFVLAAVEKSLTSLPFYKQKAEELSVSSHTGSDIHTKKDTEFGTNAQKSLLPMQQFSKQTSLGLSMEPYWEIVPLVIPTHTVDTLDWLGHTQKTSKHGWNTKPLAFRNCDQSYELHPTEDTEIHQSPATHPVIPNSKMSLTSLNQMGIKNSSRWTGSVESHQKDLVGGIWMMAHLSSVPQEVHKFNCIQKDFLPKKIKSSPVGLQQQDTQQQQSFTQEVALARHTTTSTWVQTPVENGWQNYNSIQFHQWTTSFETVESVHLAEVEQVYDIEVEDNHNFVANGLLVHNCHMLSTAAFNALLKTLEEPPEHVVFVLATTDPQRVLPTIISRCQRFDFRRIPLEAMVAHLKAIAAKENINITPAAVHLVASFAQGGLRDAESLLDQLSLLSGQVTVERVWDLVGSVAEPDLLELLQAIAQHYPEALLDCARRIMDRGKEPLTLLQNFAGFYRDLLIAKTAPNRSDLVAVTPLTWEAMCEQAKTWDVDRILSGQQHLAKSEVQIKNTTQPRLWLEVTLLGLLSPASSDRSSISPAQPTSRQLQNVDGLLKHQSQPQSKINSDKIAQTQPATPTQTTSTPENAPLPAKSENLPPIQQVEQDPAPSPTPAKTEAEVESVLPVSEPVIVASATPEVSTEEVWQQILSNLQPKSTRELLRQMGQLIEFDGNIARIGMRTQALCNQAKAYLPKIKAAFQATFQQEVEVKLELATATPAKSTAVKESPVTSKASIPVTSPPTNQQVTSYITATASSQASTTQRQPETKAGDLTASQISTPPITEVGSNAATAADWDDNEVAIASQRLADFFKGEVVGLKDDAFIQPTAAPNLSSSANSDWYDADAAGETEIDF